MRIIDECTLRLNLPKRLYHVWEIFRGQKFSRFYCNPQIFTLANGQYNICVLLMMNLYFSVASLHIVVKLVWYLIFSRQNTYLHIFYTIYVGDHVVHQAPKLASTATDIDRQQLLSTDNGSHDHIPERKAEQESHNEMYRNTSSVITSAYLCAIYHFLLAYKKQSFN